jgi:hypothetical protein
VLSTVLVKGLAPVNLEPRRRGKEDRKARVFDLGIYNDIPSKALIYIYLSPRRHISRRHNRAGGGSPGSIDKQTE